jgi:hypothetical protein
MNANDTSADILPSKRKRRLRVIALLTAALALYIVISKLNMAPATEGWVVDAESGEPVEGVVVVAYWAMEKAWAWSVAPAGAVAVFEEVTDKNGHYRIPGWGPRWRKETMKNYADPEIVLYRSGYELRFLDNMKAGGGPYNGRRAFFRPSMWDGKTVEINQFTGTPEERLKMLWGIIPALEGDYSEQIPLLLTALLLEEKDIPVSVRQGPGRAYFDFEIVRILLRGK